MLGFEARHRRDSIVRRTVISFAISRASQGVASPGVSVSAVSQRLPKPAFQRYRKVAGVIVATPGWALPGCGSPSTQGPWARWRLVVLFRPSPLSGAGGLSC
ncbi:hypothetical protein D3C86_793290 [compost metagenome]